MVWKGDAKNRLAKSLVTLIDDIDQKVPSRDTHNDGTIGDAAHQKKGKASDHNPNLTQGGKGIVTAMDVTHDPADGFDAGAFAEQLRLAQDPRIKYVIFDGRIFSSTVSPWTWRNRDKGPGDHSEHVHISVVDDPALFDDTRAWPVNLPTSTVGRVTGFPPTIKLGSSGPAVLDLQNLLGVGASGEFGPETEQAVRAFQDSRNLLADGIVGSHTWGALFASRSRSAEPRSAGGLSPALIEQICTLAGRSDLARVDWPGRRVAPVGYVKGMAVAFGHVYAKWKGGDSAARLMAAKNSGNDASDALSWYDSRFRAAGMDNSESGATTLRHLFVLLIGLGMRESSGRHNAGRDMSASNLDADTAEAGLFQMSWNARRASPEIRRLFTAYSAKPEGFLSIFQEGVPPPAASDLENVGTGEGVEYQRLCKACPAFAVETTAVGLRVLRKHWGPINRHEADLAPAADRLLQEVQGAVDAADVVAVVPQPEPAGTVPKIVVPPLATDPLHLLVLVLVLLSKEKAMADGSARTGQGVDPVTILLPLLLQSLLTGKRIDTTELLASLVTGKPITPPAVGQTPSATPATQSTPVTAPAAQTPMAQPIDLGALLMPLIFEKITGKPWPGTTPAEPPKPEPNPNEPVLSKPSVQLGVAGLALSTILQALGVVGLPFGMGGGGAATQNGTLATLIPLATAAVGATGGFGALANGAVVLLGGLVNLLKKSK